MSDDFVRLPQDGSGKRIRAIQQTVGGLPVFEEVQHTRDRGIAEIPVDKHVTRIEVGVDSLGNVGRIRTYQGSELLYTLSVTGTGEIVSTTDITRT